jgi:type IV fimbrial biogenesis protein FimT
MEVEKMSARQLNTFPGTYCAGITFPELLIAVAILGLTLTVAVPSFARLHHSNAMTSQVNHLISHLNLARSAAITRGTRVLLCPSSDGTSCLGEPHWHRGWTVFVDHNTNRELDDGEEILRAVSRVKAGITLTSSQHRRRIVYQPSGFPHGSNTTFTFCHPAATVPPKAVILSNSGRPRVSESKPDGGALSC